MSGGKKIINKKHVTVRKTIIVQNKTETEIERNETNCIVDTFRNNQNQLCIKAYPKAGVWIAPYFATDIFDAKFYNTASNLNAPMEFYLKTLFIGKKVYKELNMIVSHNLCSKYNPLIIRIKNIVNTIYIGDYASLEKGYSYNFGTIKWFPIQNMQQIEK